MLFCSYAKGEYANELNIDVLVVVDVFPKRS
ncbi:hypothetical protein [Sulfurisphaera ohwakuensis]|nr:hypothetical protein [Sulfurisphaera ohwakuensis]